MAAGTVKNGWMGYALATITAFLLGGGGASFFLNGEVQDVREEAAAQLHQFEDRLAELETREQKNFDILMDVSRHQAEIVVRLEYIKETLDKLER